jgi:hypothetical protein
VASGAIGDFCSLMAAADSSTATDHHRWRPPVDQRLALAQGWESLARWWLNT